MRFLFFLLLCFVTPVQLWAAPPAAKPSSIIDSYLHDGYMVKKGETVSEIARRIFVGKLYGQNSILEKLARVNPDIKNLDHVRPGTHIHLNVVDLVQGEPDSQSEVSFREPASVATGIIRVEIPD